MGLAFIAGYGLSLWLATTVATWVFWSPRASTLAHLGRGATVVAVVADGVENLFLYLASSDHSTEVTAASKWYLDLAATASSIKWACLVPAVGVAGFGLVITAARMFSAARSHEELAVEKGHDKGPLTEVTLQLPRVIETEASEPIPEAPLKHREVPASGRSDVGLAPVLERDQARWRRAYNVPGVDMEEVSRRKHGDDSAVGFCLSGGGIRSGSVAMGVLQTMREDLRAARYLISISGGGYTAGAFAQLLTGAGDEFVKDLGVPVHDTRQSFAAGSVEFDHVRRHSAYLASTAGQMLVALGVLARGLLTSFALLFTPAVAFGIAAAWFYRLIPIAVLPLLPGHEPQLNAVHVNVTTAAGASLPLPLHAVLAVVVVASAALVLWLVQVGSYSNLDEPWQDVYRWASNASVFMTRVAGVVAVAAVGVPSLVWVSGRLVSLVGGNVGVGVGGSVGTVVLTFLSSLASLLWRKRKSIQDATSGSVGGGGSRSVAVPNGLLQQLLVIVSVAVLALSWLTLFGVAAVATATDLQDGNGTPGLVVAGGIVVVVVVVGGLFDEASLSLHPFYRRRLATAFATRAVAPKGNPLDTVAVPYHRRERTTLSRYGRVAAAAGPFPQFVFAAAANLTGEDRTPPGLTAVSFTMNADWVGGPDVGWVDTATLEALSPGRLRRDVTVQAAVAISGAAIASAMGRFARWYQIVLAVSGARLGAWLPNPVFLGRLRDSRDSSGKTTNWTLPGLPRVRRVSYLLRELFNLHPYEERLLLITDGGHYENLGIVEALRRRCTTIYCVDGGGDSPPTAPGLAQAVALAQTELGVTIRLDQPFHAEPGSGKAIDPTSPLAVLNAALSKDPVITGTFTYPAASGAPDDAREGRLYIARALLWPEMTYPLLSYAAQNPVFPHDSTGDQWFGDDQFTAYTQLGRELGIEVIKVRQRLDAEEGCQPRVSLRPPEVGTS